VGKNKGRPTHRSEDRIKVDLQDIGWDSRHCSHLA